MTQLSNALTGESSLYLQMSQQQPVAWQPWSDEAFQRARRLQRPVLLSIGYSACYWCQVMAQDSYSDEIIASLINAEFVPIKVDREERPDLDEIYQLGHQMLTGRSGGWPLTMFLCPETRLPFMAATYIARDGQPGQMGFEDLLARGAAYYQTQRQEVDQLCQQLASGFAQLQQMPAPRGPLQQDLQGEALATLRASADLQEGGFDTEPKFPLPVNLLFLLQAFQRGELPDDDVRHLLFTLKRMAERGINDRMSGGFFRYSKDRSWHEPHFEKMLCDNGLLLEVYARAASLTGDGLFHSAAKGIVRWMKRYMHSPQGAYFSSMSAFTNGSEGAYYRHPVAAIRACLSGDEFELFDSMFGLQALADSGVEVHLSQREDLSAAARQVGLSRERALQLYRSGRDKLEALRGEREWPMVDVKILTSWNALAAKGLLVMARKLGDARDLLAGQQALDAICDNLWRDGRLYPLLQEEGSTRPAFLDDYVYLMDALLESLQTRWRERDYQRLLALADAVLQLHEDPEQGGLYFTANDAEALILRTKPCIDSSLPSVNGVAARVLIRLGRLVSETRYLHSGERILRYALGAMQSSPELHLSLIAAQQELLSPRPCVLMRDNGELAAWVEGLRRNFGGRIHSYRIGVDCTRMPAQAANLQPGEARVCFAGRCQPPQTTRLRLFEQIAVALGDRR
ncbi:thioredoxin domain-containing protein [Pseudomaricurvus sp. HS19]|uniref:thioredoxin domain-containing protein n=1 Tax=Pseudomaricurvus sp. HS19 TaxID=2692626 RepID=UPI001F1D8272|nr:thioredoxin domain-containing protein [Pseudomaricurvus sp. HS19]